VLAVSETFGRCGVRVCFDDLTGLGGNAFG